MMLPLGEISDDHVRASVGMQPLSFVYGTGSGQGFPPFTARTPRIEPLWLGMDLEAPAPLAPRPRRLATAPASSKNRRQSTSKRLPSLLQGKEYVREVTGGITFPRARRFAERAPTAGYLEGTGPAAWGGPSALGEQLNSLHRTAAGAVSPGYILGRTKHSRLTSSNAVRAEQRLEDDALQALWRQQRAKLTALLATWRARGEPRISLRTLAQAHTH